MRIFVACWFFPPAVSSEGLVTYKLLRNSCHTYDVCASDSEQWSYHQKLSLDADNINSLTVSTDDVNEWVNECVLLFEEHHSKHPYDAIMTRSMPPESIEVGKRIRESHPEIPWIASIADPIAKSPYDINSWIINAEYLSENEKADFLHDLEYGIDRWRDSEHPEIVKMCEYKDIEDFAISNATALIFPHEALKSYVLGSRRRKNAHVVHHSFDRSLYPIRDKVNNGNKTTLVFTGHSDPARSLEPVVRSLNQLRIIDENALDKLEVKFIGHVNDDVRALVYNFDLYNHVTIIPNASYVDTLAAMVNADWLIHVDASFDFLDEEGKSVYFAGKIADYLGANKPILGITGTHSPAYEIINRAGGACFERNDIAGIATMLASIADGVANCDINKDYRERFSSDYVAAKYDTWLEQLLNDETPRFEKENWPTVRNVGSCKAKFLTICVPAYNVESYLDRNLFSLISCPEADQLEILVVDDGSPDNSAQIALAYQEHYPTIVKVIRKENGGHGSTINAALAAATGIYFRVVDGDDWVDSANLATLIRKMREGNLWPDLVTTNYQQVFAETGVLVPWERCNPDLDNYVIYDFASTDMTNEYFTIHSMMSKTELLRSVGFDIQEHTYYVDVEYMLFAIPYIETVMFTHEYVYRYAVGNAEQSINPNVFASRYDHHDRVIRRMVAYYADHAESMKKGQRDYMKSLFIRHLLNTHYLLSLVWDPNKNRGYKRAKDFDEYLKATAPDLYSDYGKSRPTIMAIRAARFNPTIGPRPSSLESLSIGDVLRKTSYVISRNPLGDKIVHNSTLRGVAMRFIK